MNRDPIALTVWYDQETGEVSKLLLTTRFSRETILLQADVLRDVAAMTDAMYRRALVALRNETRRRNKAKR